MWGAKEQGMDKGRCVCVSFIRGRNHTALYRITRFAAKKATTVAEGATTVAALLNASLRAAAASARGAMPPLCILQHAAPAGGPVGGRVTTRARAVLTSLFNCFQLFTLTNTASRHPLPARKQVPVKDPATASVVTVSPFPAAGWPRHRARSAPQAIATQVPRKPRKPAAPLASRAQKRFLASQALLHTQHATPPQVAE